MNAWSRPAERRPRPRLRLAEAWLAARILGLALSVPWLMRFDLRRVARFVEPSRNPALVGAEEAQRVLALIDRVFALARPVLQPTCLTRGLTRYYFLRRVGVEVDLVFGLGQLEPPAFTGHCWLVRDGEPFLERTDPRPVFAETYRISPTRAFG